MDTAAQYDNLAAIYDTAEWPYRTWVEMPSILRVLGDLTDKTVVDIGCGEGRYSRALRHAGASGVVGVDGSPAMINIAKQKEDQEPLGVKYDVYEAALIPSLGEFDIALAVYLFHYAPSTEKLRDMFAAAGRNLRPGGRLVAAVHNPDFDEKWETRNFGYRVHQFAREDAAPVNMELFPNKGTANCESFTIRYSYYRRVTYEKALRSAGFREISWHRLEASHKAPYPYSNRYWDQAIENPYSDILSCVRG
ncbi:class I SAM-dependent DNA methyltransferase [Streptomyces collinus]|uniref:class I SAM-dependent DNA methyltransferase n=1 Tax=Streptomyces collinus TaxID=42684 RepID=UPI00369E099F